MLNKIKKIKFIDWILIILVISIPIFLLLIKFMGLDNDLWYLLSEGRYIIKNGIYHIDPISMHKGLDIVVQNWLSAVIFWIIYSVFKSKGIFFMVIIINCLICYLLYKLCMLLSDKNKPLSILITIITDSELSLFFIVSRPQIFSFAIFLILFNLLELYIKNDDTKYLKFIPLLSILEINLHASLWWFIPLYMTPYIIDSFKNEKLMLQGYRKKPLIITLIASFLTGMLNPYGYKAILFIFNSYGDNYMFNNISELQSFNFNDFVCTIVFFIILTTMLTYVYFRKGKVRVRYICLYCGTLILGMNTIKALSHFILVASFPIALLLKDIFPRKIKNNNERKICYTSFTTITVLLVCFNIFKYYSISNKIELKNEGEEAINAMDIYSKNSSKTTYVSFDDGGYLSFRGYKPYIDPRAEVYLKKNNHKEDIYKEYCDFESGKIDTSKFMKKYNFDFIFLKKGDRLYNEDKIDNYSIIYDKTKKEYKVYVRNDIIYDSEENLLIK